jgi:DNA-directed RNA polymerase II subunit RPB2
MSFEEKELVIHPVDNVEAVHDTSQEEHTQFDSRNTQEGGAPSSSPALLPARQLEPGAVDAAHDSRLFSKKLLDTYFRTVSYPFTKHHIDSYDQFMSKDLINIIRSKNPILILKDLIPNTKNEYTYKVEIFVGGKDGSAITIGSPTIILKNSTDVRLLFPNEARLRNLTYASSIYADIDIRVTYTSAEESTLQSTVYELPTIQQFELFKMPIMLHSKYCLLHNKPKEFLTQAGECHYDAGGYFVVDGAEKVLITRQEQAFNTLYITKQDRDPDIHTYATISCLSPSTRIIKRISLAYVRKTESIQVSIPMVRKPVPLFILFRALGIQSDEDIIRAIIPNLDTPDGERMANLLIPSIIEAAPFFTTYTAIQYIKTLTKGFGEAHVLDIIHNQFFIHIEESTQAKATYLADAVRRMLFVVTGYDKSTDKDDIRNQRCLVSGFLIQMLFQNAYNTWVKAVGRAVDEEYNYNKSTYSGANFVNIFNNTQRIFPPLITDLIMRGFKGRWGTGLGEEKAGVLQSLSRLSYMDFMSHCRRVLLNFDTSLKLTGPRHLHSSQFGYFCTHETPGGASIGITKNLSILTAISTATNPKPLMAWLKTRGGVLPCENVPTGMQRLAYVPIFINGGMFGFTKAPVQLVNVLRLFKRTGFLSPSASCSFNIRERRVFIYLDEGRPMRPLVVLEKSAAGNASASRVPYGRLQKLTTWRNMVMGIHPDRQHIGLEGADFIDPLVDNKGLTFTDYERALEPFAGCIEYIDPYEHNEIYVATFPEHINSETSYMELHPSSMMGLMTSQIPYANHNQSPRNQLSCSQSKQGVSIYTTNWKNRYDNNTHILCYGEAPLSRTLYWDYVAEGRMPYGMNIIVAIASYTGYNQDDGIVMNADAIQRGLFRSVCFRTYEIFEEDDERAQTRIRIANPAMVPNWMDLRPGLDYSKLDERGIIRIGEVVDETTVLVGAYMLSDIGGVYKDASLTPQVWTSGRVEDVVITVSPAGLRMVKVRIIQDRVPELGDKFCLTEDHDVFTPVGWVPIKTAMERKYKIGQGIPQANNRIELDYVDPLETHIFNHSRDKVYQINMESTRDNITVTGDHRLVIKYGINGSIELVKVVELQLSREPYMIGIDNTVYKIKSIHTIFTEVDAKVYCFTVPTGIFAVRKRGASQAFYTGNSNRHGQKGTIGMLVRGHDMPRTQQGIVPDMIMNPHAIPSRMTIAQLLEQIGGKTAALGGSVADGTAFMNEGSPADVYGSILENQFGFERYGNEILYNGQTGEQMEAAVFIGPLYGMRLKHMVEDKWNARGQGRREQRTHQPTGGRGNQGGLKIGEQERDTIICHGTSSFLRESITTRSDGARFPICTGCGTIPIYNVKLGIQICSLCQGPLKYVGNNADNLELLPPLSKPTNEIIEVEMPYATKLFEQEINTFLNMRMSILSARGLTRLRGTNKIIEGIESATVELHDFVLPDLNVRPEEMAAPEEKAILIEDMDAAQRRLEDIKEKIRQAETTVFEIEDAVINAQAAPAAVPAAEVPATVEQPAAVEQPPPTIFVDDIPTITFDPTVPVAAPATAPAAVPEESFKEILSQQQQPRQNRPIAATKRTLCVKPKLPAGTESTEQISSNTPVQVVKLE